MTMRPMLDLNPSAPATSEAAAQASALRALVSELVDARIRALVQPNALTPAKRQARPLTDDRCLLDVTEKNAVWRERGGVPSPRVADILIDLRGADLYATPDMLSGEAARALAAALVEEDCGRHFPTAAWAPLRELARRTKGVV